MTQQAPENTVSQRAVPREVALVQGLDRRRASREPSLLVTIATEGWRAQVAVLVCIEHELVGAPLAAEADDARVVPLGFVIW